MTPDEQDKLRFEILTTCADWIGDRAIQVRECPALRPPVYDRVIDDISWSMWVGGAAKDRDESARVRSMARLLLATRMREAGMGGALDTFVIAGQRLALRRMKHPGVVADLRDAAASLHSVSAAIDAIATGREADNAVPTGLRDLDERLNGGLPRGEITLMGAPTGGGKTTLAMQIAADAAEHDKGLVLVVSPEMQARDLWLRLAHRKTGWARHELRPGAPNATAAVHAMTAAVSALAERSNLILLDKTDADMTSAMAAAMLLHAQRPPLYLCILDYAQQLASLVGGDKRYLEVGRVATEALRLASETNAAVLVVSQVNVNKRGPGETDITFRETALLEHKSTVCWVSNARYDDRRMDITIRKNRHGALGKLEFYYEPATYTIADLGRGYSA